MDQSPRSRLRIFGSIISAVQGGSQTISTYTFLISFWASIFASTSPIISGPSGQVGVVRVIVTTAVLSFFILTS